MKLLAVIISLLILTAGCVSGKKAEQPVVQPQPIVVEQPTYQGITQYDYKAGKPDELTKPVITITDNSTVTLPVTTPQQQTLPVVSSSSYSYSYWMPYYPPEPVIPVVIIIGTIEVTVE